MNQDKLKKLDIIPFRYDKIIKIVLIGDSKVGKTSFLRNYLDNKLSKEHSPTVGSETKSFCCSYEDRNIKFQICDMAGIEKYKPSPITFYKGINGAIIMFDVNNVDSFINLEHWLNEINKYKMQEIPIILVGNKIDIIEHKITNKIGNEFAENLGLKYISISVKDNYNLDKIFELFL